MKLDFHRDIYLPATLVAQVRAVNYSRLTYTRHAAEAALADGLRPHQLPVSLAFDEWVLVHVETWAGRPTGVLVRRALACNPRLHLVMAVSVPDCRVKTVWLNRADDNHRTLDRTKYVAAAP
jgi:hypothetical protein